MFTKIELQDILGKKKNDKTYKLLNITWYFIICNYKYRSWTIKPSKLSPIGIEDFLSIKRKGKEQSETESQRRWRAKKANGQVFLHQATSLYYAGESALFSPTRRLESREKENRGWHRKKKKGRKGRRKKGGAKRNVEEMPLAFSQSRRNFARLDRNSEGLKNEHCL